MRSGRVARCLSVNGPRGRRSLSLAPARSSRCGGDHGGAVAACDVASGIRPDYAFQMAPFHISRLAQVLAIDIGATSIKFCHVDDHGTLLEVPRRRPTPYPCTPDRLVALLSERIGTSKCPRGGVGFPGKFVDGHVIRPDRKSVVLGKSVD